MTDNPLIPEISGIDDVKKYKEIASILTDFFPKTLEPLSLLAKQESIELPGPFQGNMKVKDIGDEGIEINFRTAPIDAENIEEIPDNLCTINYSIQKIFLENCEQFKETNPLFYQILQLIDNPTWGRIQDLVKENNILTTEHTIWIDKNPKFIGSTLFSDEIRCDFTNDNLLNPPVYNCYKESTLKKST